MQLIAVSKILIPHDRQRKEFEPTAMQELVQTIQAKGLMHAPVMRETAEGTTLVAGERRIRAVQDLWMLGGTLLYNGERVPEGFIPYVTLGQLTPLQAEEAELEENLHRKDLTWQESSAAMAKLHRIRSAQAQAEGRVHTIADTAVETRGRSDGSYQDSVRKELIVARHLGNPEIAKAKDVGEAFKILKKQETAAKNVELARSVGSTYSSQVHEAHNVDCLSWMAVCDEGLFDVILTDPPYGMGADSFGTGGANRLANNTHDYKDDIDTWRSLMMAWAPLSYRVTKPQAHAYVFCDLDNFHELKKIMQSVGWYVFRTPFIYTKPGSGRVPLPDEGPRRQYETLLYAIKGHKKTTAIYPDVLTSYLEAGTETQHGAQKSVSLFEQLLVRSVRPGDTVLDSFAGSGTIFPAATTYKCKAVGLEMNPEYFGMCLSRLRRLAETPPTVGNTNVLTNELQSMLAKGKV